MSNVQSRANTGYELCDDVLKPIVDKGLKDPFDLSTVEAIKNHRAKSTADTAESVHDNYLAEFKEAIDHKETTITGKYGSIKLSAFAPKGKVLEGGRPCLYFIHGGGFVINNRFSGVNSIFSCIRELQAVCVSVEYSLAPDTHAPVQVEECYSGLEYVYEHPEFFGINRDKIAVIGRSAGAALLVGVNLKALDKIKICCNIMSFPMVDHECKTRSHSTFCNAPYLTGKSAECFWKQYLGSNGSRVTKYTVPAKATKEDLKHFTPTLVELAKADVLHDEGDEFCKKLQSAGVGAKLATFAGYHCFEGAAGNATISKQIKQGRVDFLKANQMK